MRRRKLRLVASILAALGLMAGMTGTAAAVAGTATCYISSPAIDSVDVWSVQDGVWYCHYLPNGNLCLRYINNFTGVDIHYDKTAGSTIKAYFSYVDLITGTPHCSGGAFTENVGDTKSYAWSTVTPHPDNAIIGWMDVQGQTDGANGGTAFGTAILHRNRHP
jgi:hypothetical protein